MTDLVSVADVALIGLGEVGGPFLEQMLQLENRGIRVLCVAELSDTPGRRFALDKGVPIKTVDEILAMGPTIDVVFDLTGSPELRRLLRQQMQETGNRHTIIAPETMARMLWSVISDKALAATHSQGGY